MEEEESELGEARGCTRMIVPLGTERLLFIVQRLKLTHRSRRFDPFPDPIPDSW